MYTKKSLAERMQGKENPFLENWKFPVSKADNWRRSTRDENGNKIPTPVFFEREPIASLFLDEHCEDKVRGLSSGAQRLLFHVLFTIDKNKDYIQLDPEEYLRKEGKKSIVAFKNARIELCNLGFLSAATTRGVYWINPARFFRGNRPNTFPNNRDVQYTIKW